MLMVYCIVLVAVTVYLFKIVLFYEFKVKCRENSNSDYLDTVSVYGEQGECMSHYLKPLLTEIFF